MTEYVELEFTVLVPRTEFVRLVSLAEELRKEVQTPMESMIRFDQIHADIAVLKEPLQEVVIREISKEFENRTFGVDGEGLETLLRKEWTLETSTPL